MRVQPGQRERGGRPSHAGRVPPGGVQRARPPGAPRGERGVAEQEGGAGDPDGVDEPGRAAQQRARAGHAERDQERVGDGADRDDDATCSPRRPWRSTNAFWAPIATISERPKPRPERAARRSMPAPWLARAPRSPAKDSSDALALLSMDFDLEQLRTLRAVVEQGTLDAAAATLHVTPSAVSQRLRALETAAGRVLLVRSKPARPTAAGEAVLRLARQVELLAADTAAELAQAGPLPALGVAVNADSLATWFLPAIAPLAGEVAVQLHREDEANTARLLRAGTVVAAITVDPAPVAGCAVTALGAMRYRPMAAPAFAARWLPDGPAPEALAARADDGLRPRRRAAARLPADAGARRGPAADDGPSSADFVAAIGLGLGWGMVADLQRRPHRSWSSSSRARRSTSRCTCSAGGCARRRWTGSPRRSWRARASGLPRPARAASPATVLRMPRPRTALAVLAAARASPPTSRASPRRERRRRERTLDRDAAVPLAHAAGRDGGCATRRRRSRPTPRSSGRAG